MSIERLYNRTERRMMRNGRHSDAKVHWGHRYLAADEAKRRRMVKHG